MHAAFDYAAYARHKLRLTRDSDNARGSADDVDHVPFAAAGADGVPVRVKRADRNWNPSAQPKLFRPLRGQRSRQFVGRFIGALQLCAHAREQWIHLGQEFFRRQAAKIRMPEPLVPHSANAAFGFRRIRYTAESRRHKIAVLERAREFSALRWIVPQPVQEFGESPLRRINAAAPTNGFEMLALSHLRNLSGFRLSAVIAPQIIFAERLHACPNGNDGRTSRVERNGSYIFTTNTGLANSLLRRRDERAHVIGVRLSGKLRIFTLAMQRIFRNRRGQRSLFAIHDGHANA